MFVFKGFESESKREEYSNIISNVKTGIKYSGLARTAPLLISEYDISVKFTAALNPDVNLSLDWL